MGISLVNMGKYVLMNSNGILFVLFMLTIGFRDLYNIPL